MISRAPAGRRLAQAPGVRERGRQHALRRSAPAEPPRVSVIIPVYQGETTLPACLAALDAQTVPAGGFEILVVDNNSTDRSARIVESHPRARLLREPEQGAYAARNLALAHARGEILAFTDPDCVPDRDWLERTQEAFRQPSALIAIGPADGVGPSLSLELLAKYERHKDSFALRSRDPRIYYGHTNNMAVRREVFDALGPFLHRQRGADTVLVRRAVDRFGCGCVRYVPAMRVRHLEVDSARVYFRKSRTYAASARSYGPIADSRPLTMQERAHTLWCTIREERLSIGRAAVLIGLLAVGMACWRIGGFDTSPEQGGRA